MDAKLFSQAIVEFLCGLPLSSCLPMGCTRRSCGRTSGSPGRLRCRRTRRSSTPDSTAQENQKVIDTGLYGVVRHPMYMSTILLFLSMPLVLGSAVSFVIMLAYIPIIAKRIRNEEQVLEEGLEGYAEYKKRVRYKVIPFVW